jgi:hypothetical protein
MSASAHKIVAALAVAAVTALCAPVATAEPRAVTASATIDGQNVAAAATGQPLSLYPGNSVDVSVNMTNSGPNTVEMTQVQLVGRVLGLTFFSYASTIDVNLAPGTSGTVHYRLDMSDLKRQATGLINGQLIIRDSTRHALVVVPTATDVRGSLLSVYGVFGLALLVLTVLSLVDAALALARHKDSPNRWLRGLRLMTPGVGIGLVLAFTASVVRWWVPRTETWLLVAGLTAAAFFAIGYFSPNPEGSHADDDTELEETDDLADAIGPDARDSNAEDLDTAVGANTGLPADNDLSVLAD